ncbi:NAC transcription factor NAM-A1 [Tripterygium wilfordii]|uniref:NAC transcription factor NAM-A1 n=1 Tax=Tripterygium wilfordii TaxID=458696 RepID=A0A7J7CI19_TRIWF|nr:NAC domain containing protein 50-like [Tripterygium wilfordii]KAF5733713.1 NAC transcription factor NAM-A1 [Tripterygium wilfordii]
MGRVTSTELTLSTPSPPGEHEFEALAGKGPAAVEPSGTAARTPKTTSSTALAPGFRFHPTDEELVSYYLKRKVTKKPVRFNAIAEVDIYKNEPWDLAGKSRFKTRDQEWYFFSALDKKYGNGARMNRATGKGYWKATGKDREVRHDSQVIAMKKTLVFHAGRAPDGKRTNWVMHEYRLIDEELEKIGASQMEGYVLCRVFHKSNIGPPNGNRYAPFVEEEWDDGQQALVPGLDAAVDGVAGDDAYVDRNEFPQDSNAMDKDSLGHNELQRASQDILPQCKRERLEDYPPVCMLNTEAPIPLLQYKRRRHNDSDPNHSNGSDSSTRTTQDGSSSTSSMMTTSSPNAATTTAISALLEFSLMGSMERKEGPRFHAPSFDINLDTSVPPSCVKLINDLHNEIHKISVERESLKLEMLSAQAMINILQTRIDFLSKENEDLKRRKTQDN